MLYLSHIDVYISVYLYTLIITQVQTMNKCIQMYIKIRYPMFYVGNCLAEVHNCSTEYYYSVQINDNSTQM